MAQVEMPHAVPTLVAPREPAMSELDRPALSEPSRRIQAIVPEPLPPFVFPMLEPTRASGAIGAGAAVGRRPASADESAPKAPSTLHSRRRSVVPLPAFDFRPGQAAGSAARRPSDGAVSPTTPTSSQSQPPRSGGHRRGGSEFIGGDGMSGGVGGLMSSSPTKKEGALPLPRTAPPPAPGKPEGRRGHAHRRSGAISCHDLSVIARPSSAVGSVNRSESAPTSPMDCYVFPRQESGVDASAGDDGDVPVSPRTSPESYPPRRAEGAPPRLRVGFSDSVEIIPRPLSPLSSDASSSQTTITGLESQSGSISSVLSGGSFHGEGAGSLPVADEERFRRRPVTAGAIMTRGGSANEKPFGEMASGLQLLTSTSYCANLRALATGADVLPGEGSSSTQETEVGSVPQRLGTAQSSPTTTRPSGQPLFGDSDSGSQGSEGAGRSRKDFVLALGRKSEKKIMKSQKSQKQVGFWPRSILSRTRSQKQQFSGRRTPTPPLHPPARALSPMIDFDSDNTCVIVSPNFRYTAPPPTGSPGEAFPTRAPSPDHVGSVTPVIDLDAAPGPFNAPPDGPQSKDSAHDGFYGAKRRMHSFGGTGGFRGPGMDYHRRSESAPELASRSSLHRLRNSSIMADVFEEDEEDVEETKHSKKAVDIAKELEPEEESGMGIHVVDSHSVDGVKVMDWKVETPRVGRKSSDDNRVLGKAKVDTCAAGQSADEEQRAQTVEEDSRASKRDAGETRTDQTAGDAASEDLRQEQVNIVLPPFDQEQHMAMETPTLTMSSSASPDFATSPFEQPSVQTPSVFTSRSSMTEERGMPPALMGQAGFEFRKSVDDVPSLASDHSTMASAVHSYANPPSRPYSNDGGVANVTVRSGSITSHATGLSGQPPSRPTTAKRASLVSLSKLVGSSRGEKSKLSIEQKAQAESPEKATVKEKRANRFSRLMSFWKSKQTR